MPRTEAPGEFGRWPLAIATALACLAALVAAPAAQAAFGLGSLSAKPANPSAGANSDFSITIGFPDAASDVKDLTIHLPPGQVGNPLATPLCTVEQLNSSAGCPANTQVGAVVTNATVNGLVPLTVNGKIFNVTPEPGEPARFGIILTPAVGPPIVLQSAVKLRPTDFGLDSIINNIPDTAMGLHVHIDSMTTTLFGKAPGTGQAFSRNPTSCTPATTNFDADSYGGATATGSATYTPTNCAALPFSPTFSASIGSARHTAAQSKPPLTTVVDQDLGESGAEEADVLLPRGVGAVTEALAHQCSVADFQTGTCPANTIVGSATATSPYQSQPLIGPVTIVVPAPGQSLPRLGLDLQGPLHIQLFGSFTLSSAGPGNSFVNLPDIPLSHFALNFSADGLVATSRNLCSGSAPTFGTKFVGWNGATQTGDVAAKVEGCGGGGGHGGHAKPKAKVTVTHASSKKPRLKLKVKAGAKKIKQTKLRLPKKLHFSTNHMTIKRGLAVKGVRKGFFFVTPSKLKLKTKPTSKLVEKVARGALLRNGKVAGKKLRFKLAVTNKKGKTTRLKLATRARR